MNIKQSESVIDLLEKFRSGYYFEYQFYWSLARRACTSKWNEVLTDLPPDELKKFRAWVKQSFQGPDVKMYYIGNADPPHYSREQEEFLFHFGREEQ